MSTLFKNAKILVREGTSYKTIEGYLGVEGKLIDYVGTQLPEKKYDTEKDMTGKLLIPGLYNMHCHAAMTLVRGAGSGLPLSRWLNEAIFPVEAKMNEADIAAGSAYGMMEMLASGVTAFEDMYDFPWAEVPVIDQIGMKCRLGRVLHFFDPVEGRRLGECYDLFYKYNGVADGRVKISVCPHSEYLTNEKQIEDLGKWLKDNDCAIHVHVSETKSEHEECIQRHGITPVAYFEKYGILDRPTVMAHCVWCTDDDFKIMAKHGCTLAHNVTSNLKLGSGIARINDAINTGVNVCLGTDGVASNNNLNMFEEMHMASLIAKGKAMDPTVISDAQIIDMATVNGARAMGINGGVLEVGKAADIAAIDLDKPHLYPNFDTVALLVFSAQASDVCMTMVDGKILYENGEYYTIDTDKVKYELSKSIERLNR